MVWFLKREYYVLKPTEKKDRVPDGMWYKCEQCLNIIYRKDFEENLKVCPKCGHHNHLSAYERLLITADPDSFDEFDSELSPTDPLKFVDSKPYSQRIGDSQKKTGLKDAVITGYARLHDFPIMLIIMDFSFVGGSMGSVVGEKVTRAFERATQERLPVVAFCASGGARMQEGILSLMQMAKTSIVVAHHDQAGLPYLSVLTHPTTAGVMASYASLGDVIIAEPNALVGFAGPRVIQQTINQILPKGFQRAEFVLRHGFVDKVVPRKEMKKVIVNLLSFFYPERDKRVLKQEKMQILSSQKEV